MFTQEQQEQVDSLGDLDDKAECAEKFERENVETYPETEVETEDGDGEGLTVPKMSSSDSGEEG